MNSPKKTLLSSIAFVVLVLGEVDMTASLPLPTIKQAQAIVGAPATPLSVAGVARRSAVRTTVAASSMAAASAASAASTAKPPPPPPQPAGPLLPLGTIVSALPAGCTSVQLHGANYFNCQGTYFRPVFQGQNIVYIVEKP